MKIQSIGGGPAGLYFSLLMKKARPEAEITVYERNRPDDTFGWGVVFSDETLGAFEKADPESFREITASFKYWRDIETFYRGTKTVSTGHGFAALSRKKLLLILQQRCRELGVELRFEHEVPLTSADEVGSFAAGSDLVLGADGVNSLVRERWAEHFRPSLDWRKCRFCWLGTTLPLEAFTFIFKESPHGLFQVHAYPFEGGLSTWIVECREEVWKRAGLDQAGEEETVAFCEELFRDDLRGHDLLTNRSVWRVFPTVRCERWHHRNVVLVGDAVHTAHFSIGSGTKLALEDAIALFKAFEDHGDDVPAALDAYDEAHRVDVLKLQKAAQTSLEWFENSARYLGQPPVQFTFNLMTRSKRITWDNLAERDPALVGDVARWYQATEGDGWAAEDGYVRPPIFTPYKLGNLELANRVVVSPMCQYSATDGEVGDWHLVHLGSRAVGGAGLIIAEMTDVEPEGRITPGCAGLWNDKHTAAWKRIVDFVHEHSGAKIGVQLAHAGRKGSVFHPWDRSEDVPLTAGQGAWQTFAPSALPFKPDWPVPREMDRGDMDRVRDAFVRAAVRAAEAGFDLVEIHMAHGYLLSSFISPLSNRRTDEYGGPLANRMRFPLEVLAAVRDAWPLPRPLAVRISASDWMPDGSGVTPEEAVEIARLLHGGGCDVVDVSSAGNVPESEVVYGRMYQVPFAEKIRYEAEVPVMAVGAILGHDHANTVLAAGRADLVAMARPHLRDAYLALHAAEHYGYDEQPWPGQYLAGKPKPRE